MILIEFLDGSGHKEVTFEDDPSPERRKQLAEEVGGLMQRGYTCFIKDADGNDHKITGYDLLSNAWFTVARGDLVPAPKTTVTVTRARAGG